MLFLLYGRGLIVKKFLKGLLVVLFILTMPWFLAARFMEWVYRRRWHGAEEYS
jgi:hypothetical protein